MGKEIREVYAFDDVLIVPKESNVLPRNVDTKTRLTPKITLNIPLISAAMDRVTESEMAIAMARLGGIGVIHKNMTAEKQALEVLRVKRSESGIIEDPVTLGPGCTLQEANKLMNEKHISGIPIVEKDGRLVGILTHRDVNFETDFDKPIRELMTTDLITAPEGTTLEKAKSIFKEYKVEKLPIVDKDNKLKGMITVRDLRKIIDFPNANKDEKGRLLVAGAVGADLDVTRVKLLVEAGVDVIVVDSAHGHSMNVLKTIELIKKEYGDSLQVVGGNIVTGKAAKDLILAGVDAVKVGIGSGSICTTRIVTGVGVPQLSAVMDCVKEANKKNIPVISDGGINQTGDIVKAIAAGASSVMIGSLFAGTEESPGEKIYFQGRLFKEYRGMGSVGAMEEGSSDRYFQEGQKKLVPEGIEARVSYRGNLAEVIFQMIGGLRAGMGYVGAKNIEELRTKTEFYKQTNAGQIESHPHDVIITKEAPNYSK